MMHHGNFHVLFQPSEFIIIGGAGLGSLIVMVPPKLLSKVVVAIPVVFQGSKQSKEGSLEVLALLYEVFAKIKRDGALAIEKDVEEPTESEIFRKYPSFLTNHAAVSLLCDTLRLITESAGGIQEGQAWQRRLEENIKQQLETNLAEAKDQVFMRVISGGVRIEIVERSGKAMFGLGEARLLPHGEKLLKIIAGELKKLSYPVWIEGQTDAHPYRQGSYTNWELSVDRANAVRKELANSGISEDRIMKVIGYAATDPIVRDEHYSPLNRRVSIVVKEKEDSEINLHPLPQPSVASHSGEEENAPSIPKDPLSGTSESGEVSDREATETAHLVKTPEVAARTDGYDRYGERR